MPDALFLRYVAGGKRILWVEFKSPNDRRKCVPWKHTPDGHYCTVCAQKNWREKEIWAGAAVWVISDFDYFKSLYEETRFL
jgi:hypothetical protein